MHKKSLLPSFFILAALTVLCACCNPYKPTPQLSPLNAVSPIKEPMPEHAETNLLTNGDFEGQYGQWQGIPEWNTAFGWLAWAEDELPCRPACDPGNAACIPCPDNCKDASASVDFGDSFLEVKGRLALSQTSRLTVSLNTIVPVGAIEAILHYNPAILKVDGAESLAAGGGIEAVNRAYLWYGREITYSVAGRDPMFTLDVTAVTSEPFTLELVYWLGTRSGGQLTPTQRITASVAASGACRCGRDPGCCWARPEFKPATETQRVYSGDKAQQWFTYGRMHEAGVYQTAQVTPGLHYEFSAMLQGWQCNDKIPELPKCCRGGVCISNAPYAMNFQLGIDPTGGIDPMADSVVWSRRGESFDAWKKFSVIAKAQGGTVTVFARSAARFDWARLNNDAYIDAAVLNVVSVLYLPMIQRDL